MQSQSKFDEILEICKSFLSKIFDWFGNLLHCECKYKIFQPLNYCPGSFSKFLSVDREYLFFDSLRSLLPSLIFVTGTRCNYNDRKYYLVYFLSALYYENVRFIDYLLNKIYRYLRVIGYCILKVSEQ